MILVDLDWFQNETFVYLTVFAAKRGRINKSSGEAVVLFSLSSCDATTPSNHLTREFFVYSEVKTRALLPQNNRRHDINARTCVYGSQHSHKCNVYFPYRDGDSPSVTIAQGPTILFVEWQIICGAVKVLLWSVTYRVCMCACCEVFCTSSVRSGTQIMWNVNVTSPISVCGCFWIRMETGLLRSLLGSAMPDLPVAPRVSLLDACHKKMRLLGGPVSFIGGLVAWVPYVIIG